MKKIVFFILIGLLSACNNDEIFIETAKQDTCEVTFDVTIPQAAVASRSFNDGTSVRIDNLTLLLFDKNGVLVAKQTATEITQPSLENSIYKGKYKVTLAQTNDKRIAHFVANYSDNIANSGTENGILSALNVSGTTDAYWQRMELENGIYVDENRKPSIGTVRLIRNFACVSVTDETGGDFLQSYALVNEPKQGTVAPYYRNAKGGFPSFTEGKTYTDFEAEGYYGIEPVVTDLYDTSTPQSSEFTDNEKYVYERNHSGDNLHNPTFVIVKGKFEGKIYYYRVDIAKNLEYYNLLRNFRYIIQIKHVAGEGYDNAKAAKNGASYNNVDVELKVEEITDGSSTLKVTPTDKTVVNGTTSLYINYNYTPSDPSFSEIKAVFMPNGKAITDVTKASGNQFQVTLKDYGTDGVEGGKQTETFTITTGSGLSRKVRITLIDKFYFLDPQVTAPGGGESYYKYSFTIPPELVESMFPLELLIRESTCSFTPAPGEQMSVELIDDPNNTGRQTWCYKRVLKWGDYDQLNGTRVECLFKANDEIMEEKTFTVTNKLDNEYFANNGEAKLKVATAVRDIQLADAYYGMNCPVTLTFSINQIEPVTINMENLSYVSTASGSVSGQSDNSFVYIPDASGTQNITLETTDAISGGNVILWDGNLNLGSASCKRMNYVSSLALSNASLGTDQETTITFNVDVVQKVWIKLGNLAPASGSLNANNMLEFTPAGTGRQTVKVKTTDFADAISAEVFVPETEVSMAKASGNRTLNATVKVNSSGAPSSDRTVDILLDQNGKKIGTCTYKKSGSSRTLTAFEFTESSSLSEEEATIKFRYSGNYYVYETETVDLADLIRDNSLTVTFKRKW